MNLARLNHYRRSENWSLSAVPLLLMGCHTGPSHRAITLGKSASFRQVRVVRVPIVPTPGRHARNILPPNAIAINTPPKTDKAPPVFPGEPCALTLMEPLFTARPPPFYAPFCRQAWSVRTKAYRRFRCRASRSFPRDSRPNTYRRCGITRDR